MVALVEDDKVAAFVAQVADQYFKARKNITDPRQLADCLFASKPASGAAIFAPPAAALESKDSRSSGEAPAVQSSRRSPGVSGFVLGAVAVLAVVGLMLWSKPRPSPKPS